SGNSNAKTEIIPGRFGAIYEPVKIWVKGVEETTGNEVMPVKQIENDPYYDRPAKEIFYKGSEVDVEAPSVRGYQTTERIKTTLNTSFLADNTAEKPFIIHYKRSSNNPIFTGLSVLSLGINDTYDLRAGVKARDIEGNDLTADIKISPTTIDTGYAHKQEVIYRVTDSAGNSTTQTRLVYVGINPLTLDVGKGWLIEDFTYSGNKVTGFSDKGNRKLSNNRDVVLPPFNPNTGETVEIVSRYAFESKKMNSLLIPENIKEVEERAFYYCGLSSVEFSEGLEKLGLKCFESNSLTRVELPDTLVYVEPYVFLRNNITSYKLSANLKKTSHGMFEANYIKQVTFPVHLEKVSSCVFFSNSINSVHIPSHVKEIESGAFYSNPLRTATFEDGLEVMGDYVFYNTNFNMRELRLPRTLKSVGEYAFDGSGKIDKLVIPDGVTSLGKNAFRSLHLQSVNIPQNLKEISPSLFSDNDLTAIDIPDQITKIGDNAFRNNKLNKLTLPKQLQFIDYRAFSDNHLTDINLQNNLIVIGSDAFLNNRLQTLNVPKSVMEINKSAFKNNALTSIDLKDSLQKLGEEAFKNNKLVDVRIPKNITTVPNEVFADNHLEHITFAPNTQSIGVGSFRNNHLSTLVIPDTVTSIAERAFKDNKLVNLTIPDSVKSIGDEAFRNNLLTELDIPKSITTINNGTFADNRLSELTIPDNITAIGVDAFKNNALTKLGFTDDSKLIGLLDGAFANNKLTTLDLPKSVTTLGKGTFANNKFTSVNLSTSVTSLAADTFRGNPGWEALPNRVRIFIRDEQGKFVNPHNLQDSPTHLINKSVIKIHKLLEGSNKPVAETEELILGIGDSQSYQPQDKWIYEPVNAEPITLTATEDSQEITVYYRKKTGTSAGDLQIHLKHATKDYEPDATQPYGLKTYMVGKAMPLILSVSNSGDVDNIADPTIIIDLNQASGGNIDAGKIIWPTNINDIAKDYGIVNQMLVIHLKDPISASYALEIPFNLAFQTSTPYGYTLDLTKAVSIWDGNFLLVPTNAEAIGLRAITERYEISKNKDKDKYKQGESTNDGYLNRSLAKPIKFDYRNTRRIVE
ncbi:MAG: leucine-rich repeat protein, partial [Vagococcus sp.]|nr:leucine-rich repeat protein [Vagococcus sp.]